MEAFLKKQTPVRNVTEKLQRAALHVVDRHTCMNDMNSYSAGRPQYAYQVRVMLI